MLPHFVVVPSQQVVGKRNPRHASKALTPIQRGFFSHPICLNLLPQADARQAWTCDLGKHVPEPQGNTKWPANNREASYRRSSVIKRKLDRIHLGRQDFNFNVPILHLFFFFRAVLHLNNCL